MSSTSNGDSDAAAYRLTDIVALARHAAMSTTYKPALLKAITRLTVRRPSNAIALVSIGAEFARLYWNQTIVFHLRQAAIISKEPEVLAGIRSTSNRYSERTFSDLPAEARRSIEHEMARIIAIDVLRRFHASKPPGMPPLYLWHKGEDSITLPTGAVNFILANHVTLELIANHWWAAYLEKVNVLVPAIMDKVERDGARRSALTKFIKVLLTTDDDRCFYCQGLLEDLSIEVDHVLPWSYILADPLWDLVLACRSCNAGKSDRLPQERFIEKLERTNQNREARGLRALVGPPPIDGPRIRQLYEAAASVEWPGGWAPPVVPK